MLYVYFIFRIKQPTSLFLSISVHRIMGIGPLDVFFKKIFFMVIFLFIYFFIEQVFFFSREVLEHTRQYYVCTHITQGSCQNAYSDSVCIGWSLKFSTF